MEQQKRIPDFPSGEEAGRWYTENQEALNELAGAALASGKAKRRSQVIRERAEEDSVTVPITIRLSMLDVEKARKQARQKGLRYQTYIKMLLHEALGHS